MRIGKVALLDKLRKTVAFNINYLASRVQFIKKVPIPLLVKRRWCRQNGDLILRVLFHCWFHRWLDADNWNIIFSRIACTVMLVAVLQAITIIFTPFRTKKKKISTGKRKVSDFIFRPRTVSAFALSP